MSKYINVHTMAEHIEKYYFYQTEINEFAIFINDLWHAIDKMPSADVVEIVRCKDCIKYKPFENENYPCGECGNCSYDVPPRIVQEDGFCNEAERKKQNE